MRQITLRSMALLMWCTSGSPGISGDVTAVELKVHIQVKSEQPDPARPVFIWSETQPASTEPPSPAPLEIGFLDGRWTNRTFVALVPVVLSIDPSDGAVDLMDEPQAIVINPRQRRMEIKRTKATKFPTRFVSGNGAAGQGYALFLNHGCGAVTDQSWDATIYKLNAGEHLLRIWQEDIGFIQDIEPSNAYTIEGRGKIRLAVKAGSSLTICVGLKKLPASTDTK